MADSHLSIGEVLSLLQDEFPDVTISKIRFLESQGLIDPERTPSGYRKFYEYDIERLRWILVQQRENFLPLKVIKDRLGAAAGVPPDDDTPAPAPVSAAAASDAPDPAAEPA
ncbi:MAG: MerR family regulatory protein, partial [Acidimicrobiales bacterium]|nr:MerR family regulatory protein [Acidimicrobiales bacterium]